LVIGCVFMFLALSRGSISAVDLYPSHRAIYGSLTVIVAGVYLLLVGLLAEVAARFQGDSSFPLHALLVLGGLGGIAILLLSDRFHQRAKRFVSLHFRRPQYDYRLVWTTFTEQTASLTDPLEFCRAATRLISETLDVLSVTIWLVDDHGHSFSMGGSTSLSEGESRILIGDGKVSGDVARGLRAHAYPTAIEEVSGQLGEVLHRLGRKQFQNGGHYFFLPLATPDEMMGILIVGDRVSGLPFTAEEFDLIKTLGNQIVSNLLSIKLSRRLGDARKLEAFQTMSAFFVHDLKNTASTLSLMLQNLPKHFDDPSFRQDALRSISKSVDRINALIGRLGYFRQKMDINPVPTDLTALIKNTLAGLGGFDPEMMAIQFDPVPPVRVDPDQIQKVITNLVLNARDALGAKGKISIRTQTEEGWVVMSVTDTGCGMTSQFMEQSLFHPFQTSKQDGLGIGLFHSKMIVDAHRGNIEVESQLGQGTTFRVSFPLSGEQT
jgi:putative PEP-CTERM system histidine kinase